MEKAAASPDAMHGRVCVITGANRGIGLATALGLARRGATVVLMCRDANRCAVAREHVQRESGNADISAITLDLASPSSVRAAAAEVVRRHAAVHVLVNNAGVNLARRAVSDAGFEMTLAVNHLGPFLLTQLLLPALRSGAPSRIITVTSKLERFGGIRFDDLHATGRYGGLRAYAQSKLANVLFTYELAERLSGTGVTANCVHPGLVATDLMRDSPRWLTALWRRFLRTPESGARPVVWLASSPDVAGVTGRYFDRKRARRSSRRSRDVATRKWLWRVSEEMTDPAGSLD